MSKKKHKNRGTQVATINGKIDNSPLRYGVLKQYAQSDYSYSYLFGCACNVTEKVKYGYSFLGFAEDYEDALKLATDKVKEDLNAKLYIIEITKHVFADAPIIVSDLMIEDDIEDAEIIEN